jgi:hypothetical protein
MITNNPALLKPSADDRNVVQDTEDEFSRESEAILFSRAY